MPRSEWKEDYLGPYLQHYDDRGNKKNRARKKDAHGCAEPVAETEKRLQSPKGSVSCFLYEITIVSSLFSHRASVYSLGRNCRKTCVENVI